MVPETLYFPTWTMSERWELGDRTVSELCNNGERALNWIWWAIFNGDRWANTERKRLAKKKVNATWMEDDQFIRSAFRVILTLCCVRNQEKIVYEHNICIIISLKIFQSDRTISERWTYSERKLNALWAHTGRELGALWTVSANEAARRAQVTVQWRNCEPTVSARWSHKKYKHTNICVNLIGKVNQSDILLYYYTIKDFHKVNMHYHCYLKWILWKKTNV